MPSKNRKSRSLKQTRTIATHNWHNMTLNEKREYVPIGSVFHVTNNSNAGLGSNDAYRLEWGAKGKNRGTITVHGTPEEARALMTHAYTTLRIATDAPSKETVQAFIQSFCVQITDGYNQVPMWQISKDIPQTDPVQTQYQRAQSFLRSLLIRTLRNIYESVTGEVIK